MQPNIINLNADIRMDIIMFTRVFGSIRKSDPIVKEFPPIEGTIELTKDISISTKLSDKATGILKKLSPQGLNYEYQLSCGHVYSFIRKIPANSTLKSWDEDQKLQKCAALSRIIHPTTVSFMYSARLILDQSEKIKEIGLGVRGGIGSSAYVADPSRNWLTEKNAEDLAKLIYAFEMNPVKKDVQIAFWYHEYASRLYELDIRLALVTTALEALLGVQGTNYFKIRILKLADALQLGNINGAKAKKMYELRSRVVHGKGLRPSDDKSNSEEIELYSEMENILRSALRKAILEPEFAEFLNDKEEVDKKWPLK